MGKGKPMWYPDKPQNNMPIRCPRYEEYNNGLCYCEKGNSDDAKVCKGNPDKIYNRKPYQRTSLK